MEKVSLHTQHCATAVYNVWRGCAFVVGCSAAKPRESSGITAICPNWTCAKSQGKAVTCVLQINFIQFFFCYPSIYINIKWSFRNSGPITYPYRFLYMTNIWIDCLLCMHLGYHTCTLPVMLQNIWLQGQGSFIISVSSYTLQNCVCF